jgi:hypothetical protein
VARQIEFPVTIVTNRTLYAIDGHVLVDTRDYGLAIIRRFGLIKVDPVVRVNFHLQGSVAGRPPSTVL